MYKSIVLIIISTILIIGCGKHPGALEKGTPEYEFGQKISEKIAFYNPDANNIVARTNSFELTTGDVVRTIYNNMGKGVTRFYGLDSTTLKDILNKNTQSLVEYHLLLNSATASDVRLSPMELDSLLNLQYRRYGGRSNFVKNLTAGGIDTAFVDRRMRESLLIDKFLTQTLSAQMELSDEALRAIYDQGTASVRHILLLTQNKSESEKEEIRQKMEKILDRARTGEDFAQLAKEYTEDQASRDRGGLYENFGPGEMVKEFEQAAFSVPVGGISDIIETTYGYHILKVEGRSAPAGNFEEEKAELRNRVEQRSRPEVYNNYIDKLRTDAGFQVVEF